MWFYYDSIDNSIPNNKIYGYILGYDDAINKYRIFTEEDSLDSISEFVCGCYTTTSIKNNSIVINQDSIGARRIYYICIPYDKGNKINIADHYSNTKFSFTGILAMSDSFMLLVEKAQELINKYNINFKITINENFARMLLNAKRVPILIDDTLVNEIKIAPFNSSIHICDNVITINKSDNYIDDYFSINPLSKKGIDIIDNWFARWTKIFNNIIYDYTCISDLSGGLDTRIILAILKNTDIDIETIMFHKHNKKFLDKDIDDMIISSDISISENLHRIEDFICESNSIEKIKNISLYDNIKYSSLGTTSTCRLYKGIDNIFEIRINGYYGLVKSSWDKKTYNDIINEFISDSDDKNYIDYIHKQIDKIIEEGNYNKNHEMAYAYHSFIHNIEHSLKIKDLSLAHYMISPFMDTSIFRIDYDPYNELGYSDECIISSYILYKYAPELLKFRIEGNRKFNSKTIDLIKNITEQYSYKTSNSIKAKHNNNIRIISYFNTENILVNDINRAKEQVKKHYPFITDNIDSWLDTHNIIKYNTSKYQPYILLAVNEIINIINKDNNNG